MEKMNRTLLFALLLLFSPSAFAQLCIGVFGDANKNLTDINQTDFHLGNEPFLHSCSGGAYLSFSYDMNKWFALRADLEIQSQRTRNNFFFIKNGREVGYAYTIYDDHSFVLPVMGGAHFDFKKWRFNEYVGLYGMNTESLRPTIKKWDLGFVNCAGVGYNFYKNWAANVEVKYYRGFLDVHDTGSTYFKQPIYNQFVELAAGVSYTFNLKK